VIPIDDAGVLHAEQPKGLIKLLFIAEMLNPVLTRLLLDYQAKWLLELVAKQHATAL
jgi:hypothetical protein